MIISVLLFLLIGAVFIVFIVGMVKPSLILRWNKNPTRLKVFGFWFATNFILWILFIVAIPNQTSEEKIQASEKYLTDGKYSMTKSSLSDIKESDSLYNKAQNIIKKADSLLLVEKENKRIADEKTAEEEKLKKEESEKAEREANKTKQKEQLEREIASIKKGVDFSTYRGSVDALQLELVLFGTWANLIEESEKYEDDEIKKLTTDLRNRVIRLQRTEFPKMRENYAKVVGEKLWRNDIKVRANGTGKTYINFTGGMFAANANKEDFQKEVSEVLRMFRFKQSRYRWYEGADEYTYWDMEPKSDSELVNFK